MPKNVGWIPGMLWRWNGTGVRSLQRTLPDSGSRSWDWPSPLVTVPVMWCLWQVFMVQLEPAETHRQHLKGRWALSLEFNGLFIESLPSYSSQCNRLRVTQALFTCFLMTSVWKPEGEGLLLLIGRHWSWQTCPESRLKSSSTSSQMCFVPKRSMKAFSFLIPRASCYNTKKLPPNTNSIATVFGSLLKTGLGDVLKWF